MSSDAWATVALSALALAWAVTTYVYSRALKRAHDTGELHAEMRAIRRDADRIARSQERGTDELAAAMRDAVRGLDTRLRWLETNVWMTARREG